MRPTKREQPLDGRPKQRADRLQRTRPIAPARVTLTDREAIMNELFVQVAKYAVLVSLLGEQQNK